MSFLLNNCVLIFVMLPLFPIIFLLFLSEYDVNKIRFFSLVFSVVIFLFSLFFYYSFDMLTTGYQLQNSYLLIESLNVNFILGIDGLSILFLLLTTFLIPVCVIISYESIKYKVKEYYILLFFIEFFLLIIFSTLDILVFYISFEASLIPIFYLVGIWGSRNKKIYAAYQFFLYTAFGSIFMLSVILGIHALVGSTNLNIILLYNFSLELEYLLFFFFFLSLSIKVPIVPFHLWLTEAHVEAPTAGSVLFAGIILKIGGYGMIRFLIPIFPNATIYFTPFVYTVGIIGLIYSSLIVLRQTDLKKIIAYSSVVHMNYGLLGLFCNNVQGIEGSVFVMISHGIVSSALFFFIGFIYDRYKIRVLYYYKGLVQIMPNFVVLFFIINLANIGFPCTSGFVGELLIAAGVFDSNILAGFLIFLGSILTSLYTFWLINRISFGVTSYFFIKNYADLNFREIFISYVFIFLIFFMGLYPNFFLDIIHTSVSNLIINI